MSAEQWQCWCGAAQYCRDCWERGEEAARCPSREEQEETERYWSAAEAQERYWSAAEVEPLVGELVAMERRS